MSQTTKLVALCSAAAVASVGVTRSAEADYFVQADGCMSCEDASERSASAPGDLYSLEGATVWLMDSDCRGSEICDDRIAQGPMRWDSCFDLSGWGGDPDILGYGKPDLYFHVHLDGGGTKLANEWGITSSSFIPKHDHDNVSGSVHLGSWTIGSSVNDGTSGQCAVWKHFRELRQEYTNMTSQPVPYGQSNIKYWNGVFTGEPYALFLEVNWVRAGWQQGGLPTGGASALNSLLTSKPRHEFGHTLRHHWDGDTHHFNADSGLYIYGAEHNYRDGKTQDSDNDGFAFNEGWAHFWNNNNGWTPSMGTNMDIEGNVASRLKALASKCPTEDGVIATNAQQQKRALEAVLRQGPNTVHSYWEFKAAFDELYGPCEPPWPPSGAALVVSDEPWASYEEHVATVEQILKVIDQNIMDTIYYEYESALYDAAYAEPCWWEWPCEDTVKAKLAPTMWMLTLYQADLLRQHIGLYLDPDFFYQWPTYSMDEEAMAYDRAVFWNELRQVAIYHLEEADSILSEMEPVPTVQSYRDKLAARRSEIADGYGTDLEPPWYAMPPTWLTSPDGVPSHWE